MSSKIPKSLEEQSAYMITRQSYQKVVSSFIENFHPENITASNFVPEESQLIEFQACVEEIMKKLAALPCRHGRVGLHMEKAVELLTDEATILPVKSEFYIPALILKLRISVNACTDKDFDCNTYSCSIPHRLESLTQFLVARFENNDLRKLLIYKGLYPSIAEEILYSSRNITHLSLSYYNITNELLIAVGQICVLLKSLHLNHSFMWTSVSIDSLYSCFFKGCSKEDIMASYAENDVKTNHISFPQLQHTTIAFNISRPIVNFHRCFLFYYKNVESIWQNWFVEYFEQSDFHYTPVVLQNIATMDRIIKLRSLVLTISILRDMLPFQFSKLLQVMPFLKFVYIECSWSGTQQSKENDFKVATMIQNLHLLWEKTKIDQVYLKNATQDTLFEILHTVPKEACNRITSITLANMSFPIGQCVLAFISLRFSFLKQIKFSSFYILDEAINDCIYLENLVELHLRETCYSSEQNITSLRRFIMAMVSVSPNLEQLSMNVNDDFLPELINIEMPVLVLHINFLNLSSDKHFTSRCVINLVNRLNSLKTLYLEEIDSESFWLISRYFRNSNLVVRLGGLSGLPRE